MRLGGRVTINNEEQSSKAQYPMSVMKYGISIFINDQQPPKAHDPILVMEDRRSIVVKDERPSKAWSPILVTEDGKSTTVNNSTLKRTEAGELQRLKISNPIDMILGGRVTIVNDEHS